MVGVGSVVSGRLGAAAGQAKEGKPGTPPACTHRAGGQLAAGEGEEARPAGAGVVARVARPAQWVGIFRLSSCCNWHRVAVAANHKPNCQPLWAARGRLRGLPAHIRLPHHPPSHSLVTAKSASTVAVSKLAAAAGRAAWPASSASNSTAVVHMVGENAGETREGLLISQLPQDAQLEPPGRCKMQTKHRSSSASSLSS